MDERNEDKRRIAWEISYFLYLGNQGTFTAKLLYRFCLSNAHGIYLHVIRLKKKKTICCRENRRREAAATWSSAMRERNG